MTKVRVRFAPSPTGHLHVGGARSALYNWAFAKRMGGEFVLRMEDTDVERSTQDSEQAVIQDLKWLGIQWQEGPDNGGPRGPYRQSDRIKIYQEHAQTLLSQGKAFECFCSDEELEKQREASLAKGLSPHYVGTCRKLSEQVRDQKRKSGIVPSIRFLLEDCDEDLDDIIRDRVTFKMGMVGDFVIVRGNGYPTYNFACVVDDHLMEISHVIRAEEHLSNTNRQLKLYRAFGWKPPSFAHLSLVLGKDENGEVSKLSKRHGATSIDQYRADGFCRDALVNYLIQLGWSHPGGKEIFSEAELYTEFSLERIGKSPSIFDPAKLKWMNGVYIREKIEVAELQKLVISYVDPNHHAWFLAKPPEFQAYVIGTLRTRLEVLTDINLALDSLMTWSKLEIEEDARQFVQGSSKALEVVKAVHKWLEANHRVDQESDVDLMIKSVQATTGAKGKDLFMGTRVAVSGACHGVDLKKLIVILGRGESLHRASLVWDALDES